MPTAADIIRIARQFLYVREAQSLGQNQGSRVNGIQLWSLGHPQDSGCAEWATMVLDLAYQGKSPISRGGSCEVIHQQAIKNGWVRPVAKPGMLYLYVDAFGHAHHVGIVTAINPLVGIAGNTSADGKSVNGDGVYEHAVSAQVFVDYGAA